MTTWDPKQYLLFGNERLRPVLDLMARIPAQSPSVVYDLGCGTGTATALLKDRWPKAQVTGVDSSPDMLAKARAARGDIGWQTGDLNGWRTDRPADVIFSNAALHWLDDHDTVFPELLQNLKPGGVLAVQMPQNFHEPSHTSIAEVVQRGPWREKLKPHQREHPTLPARAYYDILRPHVTSLDIWEAIYYHVLDGENPVVEWTMGSILRPILSALDTGETKAFLERYGELVRAAYPRRPDGKTILPFKRLFFVAVR